MKKILRLDKKNTDIYLTYSWSGNNHGVCGHTFEVVDYFLLLRQFFRVGILLAEDIDWETFYNAIVSKYQLDQQELQEIKEKTVFFNRPSLVHGNNILFVDGGITSLHTVLLLFDNVFHFACGDFTIKNNKSPNTFILQDERIYEKCFNSIGYKKKIYFDKYKSIGQSDKKVLIYATKNCRNLLKEQYLDILSKYNREFVCLTSKENRVTTLPSQFQFLEMPVKNLFEKFDTYLYTPVPRKFDCSPRFIAECKFYNKEVIYYNIDYWDEDRGLYWRKWDIENDFSSIFLDKNDEIIKIISDRIMA